MEFYLSALVLGLSGMLFVGILGMIEKRQTKTKIA
jgi:preprotein translocase subunit Sss1